MTQKTIKTKLEIQLEKKYILPTHATSGYIAWQRMSKLQRKKFGRAYVRFYGIKTTGELASGSHRFPGMLNVLLRDKSIAYVFERKTSERITLGGESITLFRKNDQKIDWRRMKKKRSVRYIRAYCREHNIQGAFELAHGRHKDQGMYQQILKAGWSDDIFPPPPPRQERLNGRIHYLPLFAEGKINWNKVSDKNFSRYFSDFCIEHGIKKRSDLKQNAHLLTIAKKRGLLDDLLPLTTTDREWNGKIIRLPTKGNRIMWSELTDDEAEATAEAYFLQHGIRSADDLIRGQFHNSGLYKDLNQRGILPKLFGHTDLLFEVVNGELFIFRRQSNGQKSWRDIDNQTVENYVHAYLKDHGITTQAELQRQNNSLLQLLSRRSILKNVFPTTEIIVAYCGRRFRLPMQGRYILWHRLDREILNIYTAARLRDEHTKQKNLSEGLLKKIDRQKVRLYQKRLPFFDSDTARRWREKYHVSSNADLPDEILWAYGYEKYEDIRIRAKCLRKIEPTLEPL